MFLAATRIRYRGTQVAFSLADLKYARARNHAESLRTASLYSSYRLVGDASTLAGLPGCSCAELVERREPKLLAQLCFTVAEHTLQIAFRRSSHLIFTERFTGVRLMS